MLAHTVAIMLAAIAQSPTNYFMLVQDGWPSKASIRALPVCAVPNSSDYCSVVMDGSLSVSASPEKTTSHAGNPDSETAKFWTETNNLFMTDPAARCRLAARIDEDYGGTFTPGYVGAGAGLCYDVLVQNDPTNTKSAAVHNLPVPADIPLAPGQDSLDQIGQFNASGAGLYSNMASGRFYCMFRIASKPFMHTNTHIQKGHYMVVRCGGYFPATGVPNDCVDPNTCSVVSGRYIAPNDPKNSCSGFIVDQQTGMRRPLDPIQEVAVFNSSGLLDVKTKDLAAPYQTAQRRFLQQSSSKINYYISQVGNGQKTGNFGCAAICNLEFHIWDGNTPP